MNAENTEFLKLISDAEKLTLDPMDGSETIAEAGYLFNGNLDADFRNWNTNIGNDPTKAQDVVVYKMIKGGTFKQIYTGLDENLDALCLTQGQIIQFVKKYSAYLRKDSDCSSTIFLLKVRDEFFVVIVDAYDTGSFYVSIRRFLAGSIQLVDGRDRFVVPQSAKPPITKLFDSVSP